MTTISNPIDIPTPIIFFSNYPLSTHRLEYLLDMYLAKVTALKHRGDVSHILMRQGPHPTTKSKVPGQMVRDDWHVTIDIKTPQMLHVDEHVTLHGYLGCGRSKFFLRDRSHVYDSNYKNPYLREDNWIDTRSRLISNRWQAGHAIYYPEPIELLGIGSEDPFTTVFARLNSDEQLGEIARLIERYKGQNPEIWYEFVNTLFKHVKFTPEIPCNDGKYPGAPQSDKTV